MIRNKCTEYENKYLIITMSMLLPLKYSRFNFMIKKVYLKSQILVDSKIDLLKIYQLFLLNHRGTRQAIRSFAKEIRGLFLHEIE